MGDCLVTGANCTDTNATLKSQTLCQHYHAATAIHNLISPSSALHIVFYGHVWVTSSGGDCRFVRGLDLDRRVLLPLSL